MGIKAMGINIGPPGILNPKFCKNRFACIDCNGMGYTISYDNRNNMSTPICKICNGVGTLPDPDWIDKLYGRNI